MLMQHPCRSREERRAAVKLERQAIKSGDWGVWVETGLPHGIPGASGWCADVRSVAKNNLYVVLMRPVETEWGRVWHLAIRTASNLEPPWRDKQRIKNALYGWERVAVEVMPPGSELIDEADMYHMWVMPEGFMLPFTIGRRSPKT